MRLLRTCAVLAAAIAAAPSQAFEAPETMGLHLISAHSTGDGWNNANVGLYARWRGGATAGVYRNSVDRTSMYAGWTWGERVGLTLGLATGYDRAVVPLVAPSISFPVAGGMRARIAILAVTYKQTTPASANSTLPAPRSTANLPSPSMHGGSVVIVDSGSQASQPSQAQPASTQPGPQRKNAVALHLSIERRF